MVNLSIVIPCHNEPDLVSSLDSLANCTSPQQNVNLIVVINSGERDAETVLLQNQSTESAANLWKESKPDWMELTCLHIKDVPHKIAGVGNARKIGMDYASQLHKAQSHVLVCFDADCTCSRNYLVAIENTFREPQIDLASIYFEHSEANTTPAIADYELFLRYHIQALKSTGYPWAIHTIGSSMAVRADSYIAFGGMNQRKAGEDFYFLHKILPYRNFIEINQCVVYPSSRSSDRVPFGTGHAVAKFNQATCKTYYTYDPRIYLEIKKLIEAIQLADIKHPLTVDLFPSRIKSFLHAEKLPKTLPNFLKQSKTDEQYRTSIFRWLNGIRMLKLIHTLRDQSYTNLPLNEAVGTFWKQHQGQLLNQSNYEWLIKFRTLDRYGLSS